MIAQVLLGDAEAERVFELLPLSRVMPEVIEWACAPQQRETMAASFQRADWRKAIFKGIA